MKVSPKFDKFEFTDQEAESPYTRLALADTAECNRLLAAKAINFRQVGEFACGYLLPRVIHTDPPWKRSPGRGNPLHGSFSPLVKNKIRFDHPMKFPG